MNDVDLNPSSWLRWMSADPTHHGWVLYKRRGSWRWRRHYLVLDDTTLVAFPDTNREYCVKRWHLVPGTRLSVEEKHPLTLSLSIPLPHGEGMKEYCLKYEEEEDLHVWKDVLGACLQQQAVDPHPKSRLQSSFGRRLRAVSDSLLRCGRRGGDPLGDMTPVGALGQIEASQRRTYSKREGDPPLVANGVFLLAFGAPTSYKDVWLQQIRESHVALAIPCFYTDEELRTLRSIVQSQVIWAARQVVRGMEALGCPPSDLELARKLRALSPRKTVLTPAIAAMIVSLFSDEAVATSLGVHAQDPQFVGLGDLYFVLHNIDRLASPNFLPTVEDVIRVCLTKNETEVAPFTMAQREPFFRLLSIHCPRQWFRNDFGSRFFTSVNDMPLVVFFLSALWYNAGCPEDADVNMLLDALLLYREVVNSPWMQDVSVVVFVTDREEFERAVTRVDLGSCFPEYPEEPGQKPFDFIQRRITSLNQTAKDVYVFDVPSDDPRFVSDTITRVARDAMLLRRLGRFVT